MAGLNHAAHLVNDLVFEAIAKYSYKMAYQKNEGDCVAAHRVGGRDVRPRSAHRGWSILLHPAHRGEASHRPAQRHQADRACETAELH